MRSTRKPRFPLGFSGRELRYCFQGARGDQCDTCCQTLDAIDLIDKKCKICSTSPISRLSKHLFIDLPTMQPSIEEWYNSRVAGGKGKGIGHWSANGRAFTEAWLRDGLKERCMTRDLKWGVPVPLEGWEDKVMYVWVRRGVQLHSCSAYSKGHSRAQFDAPIGYPSITANYTTQWRKWWQNPKNVTLYQFMGKDNGQYFQTCAPGLVFTSLCPHIVPFHTILFPAYLLGSGQEWTMLQHISTTGALRQKMLLADTEALSLQNISNMKTSSSQSRTTLGSSARMPATPESHPKSGDTSSSQPGLSRRTRSSPGQTSSPGPTRSS